MRGDRPGVVPSMSHAPPATPHARGSTFVTPHHASCHPGYPACAGIDLSALAQDMALYRLPRMRGDRPYRPNDQYVPVEATPHARGSTFQPISAQFS